MITFTAAFLIALGISALLTPVVRNLATHHGLLDRAASSRKVHTTPIPRLGGIAIVVAFYGPLAGLLILPSGPGSTFLADMGHAAGIFIGGVGIAVVGLYDDLRGMGAVKKFSAQFLIAAVMYALGISIEQISTPWGAVPLGAFGLPFTMIWIVGVINAMNLIDGLDGLASGVAFMAVGTNFVIAAMSGNTLMMLLMASLAGAILGFLIYNFNPASIFMGDTGSMFLGFVIATSSIVTSTKAAASVAMIVPILALGLPIMDTFLAMGRRLVRGLPMFAADKEHIHHKLLALGLSQRGAVLILYGLCVLFAALALGATYANGRQTAMLLAVLAVVVVVLVRKLGYFSLLSEPMAQSREKNLAVRELVREAGERLAAAVLPAEAWEVVQPLAPAMGLSEMSLRLATEGSSGGREHSEFHWKVEGGDGERLGIRLPVESAGDRHGELEVAWRDGRRAVNRDDEIALELLRDHLATAARRISARAGAENVVALKAGRRRARPGG